MSNDLISGGEYRSLKDSSDEFLHRGISEETCETFGVKVAKGGDAVVFPFWHDGHIVAQKVRYRNSAAKGSWTGTPADAKTLFGQHLFENTAFKKITITEGEYDCLAAYEMFGSKWPVVSLRDGVDLEGTKAVKECRRNYDFLNSFEEIVLSFDNDEPGQASAKKVAELFPIGKVKILTTKKYKDANDYLLNGESDAYVQEFWKAQPFTPRGIVPGTGDMLARIAQKLEDRNSKNRVQYPWEGLNKLAYGIRTSEMVTLVAGTGVGKSLAIGHMAHHILKNTDSKIALMMMEESVEMANLRLMSIEAEKPFHLPTTESTYEELQEYHERTVGLVDQDGTPRVWSFDHFGSNTVAEIISRIDAFAAYGCKYIFLDHISIIVSDQQSGDERKALDEIATKLRTMVQERDLCLFMVSHLRRSNSSKPHEEGGQTSIADIRGTAGIGQLSDMVIGFERNGQADDPKERNTTRVRVLKNRFSGDTGLATQLYYIKDRGILTEIDIDDEDDDDDTDTKSNSNNANTSDSSPTDADRRKVETEKVFAKVKDTVENFDWENGDEIAFG